MKYNAYLIVYKINRLNNSVVINPSLTQELPVHNRKQATLVFGLGDVRLSSPLISFAAFEFKLIKLKKKNRAKT